MPRPSTGTVEFRGTPGRWFARITAKDEHGKTTRPWVDLERPDLKDTPEGKAIAKRIAAKRAKTTARRGVFVGRTRAAAPSVTLTELEEKWFALIEVAADMKPATRAAHKSNWRANVAPKLGKHSMAGTVWTPVLRAWLRELRAESAPSTVRNSANTLTRFFADAKAERWSTLTTNPMRDEDVRAELPSVETPEPDSIEHWTREAFAGLLALPTLPAVWFGLYLIDAMSGLRAGELFGLQWKHAALDAEVAHLRIRQQLSPRREGEPPTLGAPKTRNGRRDVPLHPAALAWLVWWKATGFKAYAGHAPEADDFLFPDASGEAWRPYGSDILRGHLDGAGLSKDFVTPDGERLPFTFNAIRHSFASWLGEAGVAGDLVDRLLGHTPRTTRGRHYQAIPLPQLARAVATLTLALPKRPGVAPSRPPESSRESSQRAETAGFDGGKDTQKQSFAHNDTASGFISA